ncbi:uncharacterized protein LOC109836375 isoform X2 [Asparagus officinalis]|uniref:uncharacterized protein LOC109836375 isoform X2 n=1 Tax=Asparagus officinalis TaxID=4686 RepID=UPI00098E1FE1|nr:uncharacterized protein LOC109836375 isoform X2 [Asparagus officinalis]
MIPCAAVAPTRSTSSRRIPAAGALSVESPASVRSWPSFTNSIMADAHCATNFQHQVHHGLIVQQRKDTLSLVFP